SHRTRLGGHPRLGAFTRPMRNPESERQDSDETFVRRVFILVGIAALIAALWVLSDIVLLVFGAVLLAVILHTIAQPLGRMGVGHGLSVLLAGAIIVGVLAAAAVWFGPSLTGEFQGLARTLPEAA